MVIRSGKLKSYIATARHDIATAFAFAVSMTLHFILVESS